jgi:predicted membrane protein (TIGR00267 family)
MGLKSVLNKWKKYSTMSDLGIIARRKFFNNCFDGALTCAGIVSGMFILFLNTSGEIHQQNIILPGLATALAIGISGLWGAYLSEEAERKKKLKDLKKEMVWIEEVDEEGENVELDTGDSIQDDLIEQQEIAKAMLVPINYKDTKTNKRFTLLLKSREKKRKNNKSVIEQAEKFATIIASIVDGGAPVLGSSLPLIPFFFGTTLTIFHFMASYIILAILLVYLGIFLGNISGGGRLKYALHLLTAGIVTLLISSLLGI